MFCKHFEIAPKLGFMIDFPLRPWQAETSSDWLTNWVRNWRKLNLEVPGSKTNAGFEGHEKEVVTRAALW